MGLIDKFNTLEVKEADLDELAMPKTRNTKK